MIEKNSVYWSIHKIVFEELYDDLDNSIKDVISNNPNSKEGIILNQKIEAEVNGIRVIATPLIIFVEKLIGTSTSSLITSVTPQ